MFKFFTISLLFGVCIFLLSSSTVRSQDDPIEDEVDADDSTDDAETEEDIDSKVESEPDPTEQEEETATTEQDAPEDEEETSTLKSSPNAVTTVLFPDYPDKSLPAGKVIYSSSGFITKAMKISLSTPSMLHFDTPKITVTSFRISLATHIIVLFHLVLRHLSSMHSIHTK